MAYDTLKTLDDLAAYFKSRSCYGQVFKENDFKKRETEILQVLNQTDRAALQQWRFDIYRGLRLDHNLNVLHAAAEFSSEKMLQVLDEKGVYFPSLMREKTTDGRLALWDCIEKSGYCLYDDPNVPRHMAAAFMRYSDRQIRKMEEKLISLEKENTALKGLSMPAAQRKEPLCAINPAALSCYLNSIDKTGGRDSLGQTEGSGCLGGSRDPKSLKTTTDVNSLDVPCHSSSLKAPCHLNSIDKTGKATSLGVVCPQTLTFSGGAGAKAADVARDVATVADLFKPMTVVFHSGTQAKTFFTLYSGTMQPVHQ